MSCSENEAVEQGKKVFVFIEIFSGKLHLTKSSGDVILGTIANRFGRGILHKCEYLQEFVLSHQVGSVLDFDDYCNFVVVREK